MGQATVTSVDFRAAEAQLVDRSKVASNDAALREHLLHEISPQEWEQARATLANPTGDVGNHNRAATVDALQLGRALRAALQAKDPIAAREAARDVLTTAAKRASTINLALGTLSPSQLSALVEHARAGERHAREGPRARGRAEGSTDENLIPLLATQLAAQEHPAALQPHLVAEMRRNINDPKTLAEFNRLYAPI